MSELHLVAERRTVIGKQVKRLRREGRVPGIVYGPVVPETVPVTVDRRVFSRFYQTNGHATLFTLRWDGGEESVFIREVQQDPVKRLPLHVDFFAPNLLKALRAMVPLVLHNPDPNAGGIMTQLHTEVEVEGLPSAIPNQIDADISGLSAVGDALRIGDLSPPEGIVFTSDAEEPLVQMSAETEEEEPEVDEEAELAEGEEGAARDDSAEGETDGGRGSSGSDASG